MESQIIEELNKVEHNQKQNQATRCAVYLNRASKSMFRQQLSIVSATNKIVELRRLSSNKSNLTNSSAHFGRSFLNYYLNYKKSGRPERLMFYQNGEWMDFPKDVVDLLRKDLQGKKETIEVECNGHHLVLDFLHMYQMDLTTGFKRPIAWIDEIGGCFFPEVYVESDKEPYDFNKQEDGKSSESNDVKLHLEIEINKRVGEIASASKSPKSPWIPFPMLFAAISDEVPPENIELIYEHYEQFKANNITRDDFIKNVRLIVGDTLLETTITNVSCKVPSKSCELKDLDNNKEG